MKTFILLMLAVVAVVGLVQWRAGAREARAEAGFPAQGKLLDVNGTPVHVVEMGTGPDLVLIHGASGNTRDMTFGFAQDLSVRFRVIIFDRPALGWTGHIAPEYGRVWTRKAESPFQQAALLQAAAKQIGVERPIVLGQSFGGAVAWAWALTDAETAGVVSVAGVANPWPGELSRIHRVNASVVGAAVVVPMITAFTPDKMIDSTLTTIFAPNAVPDGYKENVGVGLTLRRKTLRGNARQVTSLRPHIVQISERYGELSIPVEIVHGDADTIVPLEVHSALLPDQITGANLTVLEGAGHMPHHTHRADVLAAVDRVAARAGLR